MIESIDIPLTAPQRIRIQRLVTAVETATIAKNEVLAILVEGHTLENAKDWVVEFSETGLRITKPQGAT